jgi:LEA14-like dessication related protein
VNGRLHDVPWSGRRAALGAALGALLIAALGCSSLTPLEPLGVNLVNLEVQEITLFEATLVAKIRVSNPNPDPLQFSGGSLKLLVDERKIGTAMTSQAFAVAGFESTVIDMTVHCNTASAITRIPALLKQDSVSYGVRGALYSQGSFGTHKHVVERSGSLDLTALGEPDRPVAAPSTPS